MIVPWRSLVTSSAWRRRHITAIALGFVLELVRAIRSLATDMDSPERPAWENFYVGVGMTSPPGSLSPGCPG